MSLGCKINELAGNEVPRPIIKALRSQVDNEPFRQQGMTEGFKEGQGLVK